MGNNYNTLAFIRKTSENLHNFVFGFAVKAAGPKVLKLCGLPLPHRDPFYLKVQWILFFYP